MNYLQLGHCQGQTHGLGCAGQWFGTTEPFVECFYKNWIMPFTSISIALNGSGQMESGSFRSYSRSVRSFPPGSFRSDFRGESFRPKWGGSFRPNFKVSRFSLILGLSRFGLINLFWENRSDMRLSSPQFCFVKDDKSYLYDSVTAVKEPLPFRKIPPLTT